MVINSTLQTDTPHSLIFLSDSRFCHFVLEYARSFDGLQPFLFAHITAIRPFLFLVTARLRAFYVPFYVFRESRVYAVPAKTI
jgi:hypothetical protein